MAVKYDCRPVLPIHQTLFAVWAGEDHDGSGRAGDISVNPVVLVIDRDLNAAINLEQLLYLS